MWKINIEESLVELITNSHDAYLTANFEFDIPTSLEIREKTFGFNEVCISLPSNEKLKNSMKNNIYLRKTYQESSHPIIINNVVMNYIEPKGEEILDTILLLVNVF